MHAPTGMQIYDTQGHRLYLTGSERAAFRAAAAIAPREVRAYCWVLLYTVCRPSEALALTADRVDFQAEVLTFESKKKRRPGLYRAVPVPATLLEALDLVHGLRDRHTRAHLWTWSLKTAYTRVIEVMAKAGIAGPQATPKGLRHGFGVACIEKGIPLNLVQRWLGHAQLSTTAIYADAVGEEERHSAARLWA
jgi:integrase/recombinase XerD